MTAVISPRKKVDLRDLVKDEYGKCASDPRYFMRRYCYIQHKIRGRMLFDLYRFQDETIQILRDKDRVIILKARQIGISTVVACYSLWVTLFHRDKTVLVIATKQETAKNLISKAQFAYEHLPVWLRSPYKENNKLNLKFKNGSEIKAVSSTGDAGRSEAVSLLIIDEAAHIDRAEEIWISAQSTLATGGRSIIISCVPKETLVFTDRGLQSVGNLIDSSKIGPYQAKYLVAGFNGKLRSGEWLVNNGHHITKKIITKFSHLEGTLNHKVWAYKSAIGKYDWYPLENLSVGDWVAIQSNMNIWGNNDDCLDFSPSINNKIKHKFNPKMITPNIAYLLGLFISEGSSYRKFNRENILLGGWVDITCGDDISNAIIDTGLHFTTKDNLHYRVSSKNFIEFLEYLGFNLSYKAHNKIIPARLLFMSKENIVALLQGIFDGDGSASKRGGVSLASTSEELINQVRMLLLNMGILSSYVFYSKVQMNSYEGKIPHNYDTHILEIGGKNALKYFNEVGFRFERKQIRKHILDRCNFNRNTSMNVIPNSGLLIQRLVSVSGKTFAQIRRDDDIFLNGIVNKKTPYKTDNISKELVLAVYTKYAALLTAEEIEDWNRIINDNIVWDKIKDVDMGNAETYDFSLPNDETDFWCHSVLYNGIVGHQTPNGVGNFFHKTWVKSEEKDNDFARVKLNWRVHPERDDEWYQKEYALLGDRGFRQENEAEFMGSGNTVYDTVDIMFYKDTYKMEPIEKRGFDGNLWIWEQPNYTKPYLLVADVARGDGLDHSAFHVLEANTCTQVAEYKGKIDTTDFGHMLIEVGTFYNDALMVVENATQGWAVLQTIINRQYKNLFYMSEDPLVVEQGRLLTNKWTQYDRKKVPGFTTSSKTRPLIISKLDEYLRNKTVIIHSDRLLNEMLTFIWENGKAVAQENYNDDLIMAMAIGLWVRDTSLKLYQQNIDLMKQAVDGIKREGVSALDPIINTLPANMPYDPYKIPIGPGRSNPYGGREEFEDIRWLLG